MGNFLFRKIEIWMLLLVVVLGLAATVFMCAVVKMNEMAQLRGDITANEGIFKFADHIASIPFTITALLSGQPITGKASFKAKEQREFPVVPWGDNPPAPLPYILLSRFNPDLDGSSVELIDMETNKVVRQWQFDADDMWRQMAEAGVVLDGSDGEINETDLDKARQSIGTHPLLTENGLVARSYKGLFREDVCSNRMKLVATLPNMHHAIEADGKGGFWTAARLYPRTVNDVGPVKIRDDALLHIDASGHILFSKSLIQLLIENGFDYWFYGDDTIGLDPIHLNDVQPVLSDGPYWKAGDVFVSVRNKSLVFLYRPSTNKILWSHQGPWLHQHDVDILDDHRIAVFDNHMLLRNNIENFVPDHNDEVVYDFRTGEISRPFTDAFAKLDLRTPTNGRAEFLDGGLLFVEEMDAGRITVFDSQGREAWRYVNKNADGIIYVLNWSRVVNRQLVEAYLSKVGGCKK